LTNNDDNHLKGQEDKKEPLKMGWLDVVAFMIAAFQILLPYILIFILAILLVPALFYIFTSIGGR